MKTPAELKPAEIRYTFDHDRLRRYLRLRGAILWIGFLGPLGAFFGIPATRRTLDNPDLAFSVKARALGRSIATGLGGGAALGAACYLVFTHRRSAAEARAVSLRVDGPFVRVTLGGFIHVDRKLHFRSIIDYSLVDGPLRRRLGLRTLVMSVPTGAPNPGTTGGFVLLTGLHDCERVRDELAALDAAREHLAG